MSRSAVSTICGEPEDSTAASRIICAACLSISAEMRRSSANGAPKSNSDGIAAKPATGNGPGLTVTWGGTSPA